MGQFNTLIQSESIASITPQQILAAGEPIYLDSNTLVDIKAINTLIQSYARIHAPTYGSPIPLSGSVVSAVGAETLLAPASNEIRKVLAIDFTNAGGAPIAGTLTLGGVEVSQFAANPTSTVSATLTNEIYCSKTLILAVTVSSGDASDLTSSVASILVVQ
tara:strand:- start:123 stop:605 length:483 start_codon:yes stop_codon:yes gene_type:complete